MPRCQEVQEGGTADLEGLAKDGEEECLAIRRYMRGALQTLKFGKRSRRGMPRCQEVQEGGIADLEGVE